METKNNADEFGFVKSLADCTFHFSDDMRSLRIEAPEGQKIGLTMVPKLGAAPDLLETLLAVDSQGRDANANGDVIIPSEIWDMVSAAIAKATPNPT